MSQKAQLSELDIMALTTNDSTYLQVGDAVSCCFVYPAALLACCFRRALTHEFTDLLSFRAGATGCVVLPEAL